jgi:hypothetical protein
MKKYIVILPKPLHTEPSKVRYGGRVIKFRVMIIEEKGNNEIIKKFPRKFS